MKTTEAWAWLTAGILALGLNGIYQDGGAEWAHRVVGPAIERIAERTAPVLALAAGRADLFMTKAEMANSRAQPSSCRFAAAMARVQTKIARTQGGFAQIEAMSAREEAELARLEANRARMEEQITRVRFIPAAFDFAATPVVCPRVRVSVPRVSIPKVPMVKVPEVHVEVFGAGPV